MKRRRVLVVGGGIAGLAAVQRLREAGIATVLIEARNRLGGRVWTDANGFDLGAGWIHGQSRNPLVGIARSTGTALAPFDYENHWRYDARGELSDAADGRIEADFQRLESRIGKAQQNASADEPLARVTDREIARLPAARRPGLRYAINTSIVHEYAAEPRHLSLANFDAGAEQPGGDAILPGGYSRLLAAFGAPDETHLGQTVAAIRWSDRGVAVETNRGRHDGDAALVTLPLGVLKAGAVTFAPALPKAHLDAIARLGFGTLNKLALRFPKVAWPAKPHLFGYVGDGWWEEWINLAPFDGRPVLIGFNAGSIAEESETRGTPELTASALKILRAMFGSSLPEPVQAVATRWKTDPFSRGSYSSYAPRSSPADRTALANPISARLILAGEACSSDHPSTVHGALRSGQSAADFLTRSLA